MLDSLKNRLGYPTIVDMIKANDNGKITDPGMKKIIDDLITSKRNIIISFSIKGQKKNVYIIPLLLPLLVLIPKFRRRKTKTPPTPPPTPDNKKYIPQKSWNKEFVNNRTRSSYGKQPWDYRNDYYKK
jgi:hypothetical protein